jgi:hypothetical protein
LMSLMLKVATFTRSPVCALHVLGAHPKDSICASWGRLALFHRLKEIESTVPKRGLVLWNLFTVFAPLRIALMFGGKVEHHLALSRYVPMAFSILG